MLQDKTRFTANKAIMIVIALRERVSATFLCSRKPPKAVAYSLSAQLYNSARSPLLSDHLQFCSLGELTRRYLALRAVGPSIKGP